MEESMKRAAAFVAIAVFLMHSGASSAVERKGVPDASQLTVKELTVKSLSVLECNALGGQIVEDKVACNSGSFCKTTDQRGKIHRVCITSIW
jgi:hypothetical protein